MCPYGDCSNLLLKNPILVFEIVFPQLELLFSSSLNLSFKLFHWWELPPVHHLSLKTGHSSLRYSSIWFCCRLFASIHNWNCCRLIASIHELWLMSIVEVHYLDANRVGFSPVVRSSRCIKFPLEKWNWWYTFIDF